MPWDPCRALQAGDRVLVAEACNHNRITDICNDIGMVQVGPSTALGLVPAPCRRSLQHGGMGCAPARSAVLAA